MEMTVPSSGADLYYGLLAFERGLIVKMGLTIAEKILKNHIVDGKMEKGAEIGIRIDQTLTQDATGTMAYLEFEAMGVDRVKTERSVAYIDHNTLQSGFENAMTTNLLLQLPKSTASIFPVPAMGSVIRCTWNALLFQARR